MEAIEKINATTNWITLIFIGLFVVIFILKALQGTRLKNYFWSFFNQSLIIYEVEERLRFFNKFTITLFLFTIINFALMIFFATNYFLKTDSLEGVFFLQTLLVTFFYFSIKWLLEFLIIALFSLQPQLIFMQTAKRIYTYTIGLWVYPLLIFIFYTNINREVLLVLFVLLFLIKFLLLLLSNKKLVLNKLFYFILYICTFEIAPLFILFKLIF